MDLYSLSTVNVVRKYTSFFDSIISLVVIIASKKQMNEHPSPLLFLSGVQEVRAAQTAMTNAHKSQMRWFRWGWIGLSRYMVVNDLRLEKITGAK